MYDALIASKHAEKKEDGDIEMVLPWIVLVVAIIVVVIIMIA
jgi:hypothetical protein